MKTCKLVASTLLFLVLLPGCGNTARLRETGGNASLFHQFQAYDGRTGLPISFDNIVNMASGADVILFGEQHSNAVCNGLEAQLLAAMSGQPRPVTLAMEFFERDTQSHLDSYLDGRIDEAAFHTLTRRNKAYATSHRPMIEFCKASAIPVIAANAPWRLMRALGKSGLTFAEYRESVDPTDRSWLPRESEILDGSYRERFEAVMGNHGEAGAGPATQPASQPSEVATTQVAGEATSQSADSDVSQTEEISASDATTQAATQPAEETVSVASHPMLSAKEIMDKGFRSQSLWDDSMAEAVADHRSRYSNRRVMLVVGVFHVEGEGGLSTKTRQRRSADSIFTIAFRGTEKAPFKFDNADRWSADVVIYGIAPPEEEE